MLLPSGFSPPLNIYILPDLCGLNRNQPTLSGLKHPRGLMSFFQCLSGLFVVDTMRLLVSDSVGHHIPSALLKSSHTKYVKLEGKPIKLFFGGGVERANSI